MELQDNRNDLQNCHIYLRVSSLAAALMRSGAIETAEEAEVTLVCKGGVGVSGDDCSQPI